MDENLAGASELDAHGPRARWEFLSQSSPLSQPNETDQGNAEGKSGAVGKAFDSGSSKLPLPDPNPDLRHDQARDQGADEKADAVES